MASGANCYSIALMREGNFDYSTLTIQQRTDIHNALASTTVKHIDMSGELFKPMKFDLARSPSQELETVHLEPALTTKDETATLAHIAAPTFSPYIKEELSKQRAFMSAARILLNNGENIIPVTNHGFIADVALFSEAWAQQLEDEHWQDQNGLVISRGVTTIQAFDMAASEVVRKIGHVFMSFPRTRTISALGFDDKLVDTNNERMRAEASKWLGERLIHRIGKHDIGKSLHIAWSGKTDEAIYGDNHQPERIKMAKITKGTIDLIKKAYILPVVLWDGDEQIMELGELTRVKTIDDTMRVQKWQANTLAARLNLPEQNVTVE